MSEVRRSEVERPFDVIAYSAIRLTSGNLSRSHSLWYTDFEAQGTFKWYELAFRSSFNPNFDREPRSSDPDEGIEAFANGLGVIALGRPISVLDLGALEDFVDSWGKRLGDAAIGRFPRVYQLPDGNPQVPNPDRRSRLS